MLAIHARNVALTRELSRFVDDLVAGGAYNNTSEVVRDALRELQRRTHADRLTEIQARIGAGLEQLDRGEGLEGAPADVLGSLLEEAKHARVER